MKLASEKKAHFIGIGGIGMSALARCYLSRGWRVSGSDAADSAIVDGLRKEGVEINIGHDADNVPAACRKVVYTAAAKQGNPELVRARSLDIPTLSYAEALGELAKEYFTVAVAGSHGKSTTAALLSLMMIEAGLDPTVVVGTRLKEFGGSNFRRGQSKYLVIEACEWNNSFHHYYPDAAVITNIDAEHLDTHKNLRGVIKSFAKFISQVRGKVVLNGEDENCRAAARQSGAKNIVYFFGKNKWPLKLVGRFNQLNAEAAWQTARLVGVKKKAALAAARNYRGSWRRMEELEPLEAALKFFGRRPRLKFYSDYGHHPAEIKAVGKGLKEKYSGKKIVLVFQPHQVERTTSLFKEFTAAFGDFDAAGILPIYNVAGRELGGEKKSAEDLAAAAGAEYLPDFESALRFAAAQAGKNGTVVLMGAGNIILDIQRYFKSKLFK